MKKQLRAEGMLMMTAIIWGTAFVAQKSGMDYIGPMAFNGIRNIVGGLVLIPVILFLDSLAKKRTADQPPKTAEEKAAEKKLLIIGGICCGLALMFASSIQQIAIVYTTAGKAGFITAMYVLLVPLIGWIFLRRKLRPIIWLCVVGAVVGLYLLCIPAESGFGNINKGDVIMLICSLFFAIHILVVDYFSPKVDSVKLSCIQFFVAGIVACCFIAPVDPLLGYTFPTMAQLLDGSFSILYTGIMSCGVAYTLQVVGQADAEPTIASMILCLESVFSVIAGAIILGEAMGAREIIGCVLMFAAILIAQLPSKEDRLKTRTE